MLWLEKFVQVIFRLRDLGIEDPELTEQVIDELHRATRLREEYQLDIMSFDDLAVRIDPKKIETLVGSLLFLSKESRDLAIEVQDKGKPRELAEERWIFELADIYENAFRQPASVSGSGSDADEPMSRRGKFYRLLEVSRPESFPQHGKLSLRQIDRMLKRRRKLNEGIPGLTVEQSAGAELE